MVVYIKAYQLGVFLSDASVMFKLLFTQDLRDQISWFCAMLKTPVCNLLLFIASLSSYFMFVYDIRIYVLHKVYGTR